MRSLFDVPYAREAACVVDRCEKQECVSIHKDMYAVLVVKTYWSIRVYFSLS